MRHVSKFRAGAFAALTLALLPHAGTGQALKMPATLRYGSGLMDIPVASVLPHLAITGTYSRFSVSIAETLAYTRSGELIGRGGAYEKWLADGSFAIGLFDRVELGATIQHYDSISNGGNMVGAFGRLSVLPQSVERFDLAVGARYITSPSFGDAYVGDLQPNRFGHPDYRVAQSSGRADDFNSNLTPYVVGTANLPISDASFVSLTLGWGAGLFSAGGDLDFYSEVSSGGVFAGSAVHFGLGGGRLLNLMAEFNGFDTNAGLQFDLGGVRVGAFVLGLLSDGHSTYRSRKFGLLGSLAICGGQGGLCRTRTERPAAEPAPPVVQDPGPTAEELEAMRQDSIRRAQAEAERQRAAEAEAAERERQRLAMEARRVLEEMVFFDYDAAAIRPDAEATLQAKLDILRDNPGVQMSFEGHADARGSSEYNLALSSERANAVLGFFTGFGLDPERFSVVSYGEERPLAQGASEESWGQNRRVEFVITAGGNDIGR